MIELIPLTWHDSFVFSFHYIRSMSELEKAMVTIVQIFYKYSGQKNTLKKADLKHLINYEMSQFIKVSAESDKVQWSVRVCQIRMIFSCSQVGGYGCIFTNKSSKQNVRWPTWA